MANVTLRISRATKALAIASLLLGFGLPAAAHAQDKEAEQVRQKIESLLKKAEALRDEGANDKADELVRKAEWIKAEWAGAKRDKRDGDDVEDIVRGLKSGAAAMRALGRLDEAERLQRLAAEVWQKSESGGKRAKADSKRDAALKQLKMMRMAQKVLAEIGRKDLAEQMHLAIRADEVGLEGRKDDEAHAILKRAPGAGQRAELLLLAAKQLREFNKPEQAKHLANLGEQILKNHRTQLKRKQKGAQRGEGDERQLAARQIDIMESGLVALQEAGREDAADLLARAIQARQIRLKRVKGEDANYVLEREPNRANTAEALILASKMWAEFGRQEEAAAVGKLAETMLGRKADKPRKDGGDGGRIERLEASVSDLKEALEQIQSRLDGLKKELDQ